MLRRLSQGMSGLMNAVGLISDEKKIQAAITSEDEEKALAVLTGSESNKEKTGSFSLSVHPSVPFEGSKHGGNTALHLATEYGMRRIVDIFLENGGNPNLANATEQTALHSLCKQSSHADERMRLLDMLLAWRGNDGQEVSVNRVDSDGSTAMHYASENGLMALVRQLVAAGGIISIVNKAQRTCCELAEAQGHHQLSSMLELALIFQPADEGMEAFEVTEVEGAAGNSLPPLYVLDCSSMGINGTEDYMTRMIANTCELIEQPADRVETLLALADWDAEALLRSYQQNPEAVLEGAKLDPAPLIVPVVPVAAVIAGAEKEEDEEVAEKVEKEEGGVKCDGEKEETDDANAARLDLPQPPHQQVRALVPLRVNAGPPAVPEDIEFTNYQTCVDLDFLQLELTRVKRAGDIAGAMVIEDAIERCSVVGTEIRSNESAGSDDLSVAVVVSSIVKKTEEDIAVVVDAAETEEAVPEPEDFTYFSKCGEISSISTEILQKRAAALVEASNKKSAIQAARKKLQDAQADAKAKAQALILEKCIQTEEGEENEVGEDCPICCEAMVSEADFDSIMSRAMEEMESKGKGESELCIVNHGSSEGKCITCRAGHKFCVSCWCQHVTSKVRDEAFAALTCPGYKCGETLNMKWAPFLLQESAAPGSSASRKRLPSTDINISDFTTEGTGLLGRYRRARISRFIDCNRSCQNCAAPNCGLVLMVRPGQVKVNGIGADQAATMVGVSDTTPLPQVALCAAGHSMCLLCRQDGHAPCSCHQWEQWQEAVRKQLKDTGASDANGSATDVANALWLSANTKKCPRCSTGIEKDEGCNHMICSKCRHEFCWMCMEKWSLHSNSTGGYFQCNKFKDKVVDNEDGDGDEDSSHRFEKGSSRAETLRLKMSGRRMARFIHHFTRYSAHTDSARREALMRLETLQRIEYTLYRSATGDLHWLHTGLVINPAEGNLKRRPSVGGAATTPLKGANKSTTPQTTPGSASSLNAASTSPKVGSIASKMNKAATSLSKWFSPSKTSANGGSGHGSNHSRQADSKISEADAAYAATNFTQDEDALATSTNGATGGDDGVPYLTDGPSYLTFLRDGFDELARARQLLRGTYVQAYFLFEGTSYHHKNWRRASRMMELQSVYELLQGELEFLVEMLSDVLARRRLRASEFQIKQLLCSVRSKRIEMESTILSTVVGSMTEDDADAVPPGMTSLSGNGSLRGSRRTGSGGNGRRGGNRSTGVRPLPNDTRGNGDGSLDDAELMEMLGLISQLDLQAPSEDTEVQGLVNRSMQVLRDNGYVLDVPVRSDSAANDSAANTSSAQGQGQGGDDAVAALPPLESDSDEEEHAERPVRVRESPRSSPSRSTPARTPGAVVRSVANDLSEPQQAEPTQPNEDEDDDDGDNDDARGGGNIEEMQLQSALLMSLRQEPTFAASEEQASAENISLLVSMMEISEARAAEALMSNGHNVEAAINSLFS